MPAFARYIGVDYSGAQTPPAGKATLLPLDSILLHALTSTEETT